VHERRLNQSLKRLPLRKSIFGVALKLLFIVPLQLFFGKAELHDRRNSPHQPRVIDRKTIWCGTYVDNRRWGLAQWKPKTSRNPSISVLLDIHRDVNLKSWFLGEAGNGLETGPLAPPEETYFPPVQAHLESSTLKALDG